MTELSKCGSIDHGRRVDLDEAARVGGKPHLPARGGPMHGLDGFGHAFYFESPRALSHIVFAVGVAS
jgi:hypothetical protein